ncbi:MAG: transporter [Lachnospiraceae bacterium]|nr:transporter [Lachnospiraceae bacterium]
MKSKKAFNYLDRIAKIFEIIIAAMLLVIIALKVIETGFDLAGFELVIIEKDFKETLSLLFIFVIGVEFTKMLLRHTPEAVIEVLLFTIARQLVLYHEGTIDMLLGIIAIAAIFATKKYLVDAKSHRDEELVLDETNAPDSYKNNENSE